MENDNFLVLKNSIVNYRPVDTCANAQSKTTTCASRLNQTDPIVRRLPLNYSSGLSVQQSSHCAQYIDHKMLSSFQKAKKLFII